MSTTNKARVVPDPQSVLEAQKAEYAKDAAETDRPWERWEFRFRCRFAGAIRYWFNGAELADVWQPCTKDNPPLFQAGYEYRKKSEGLQSRETTTMRHQDFEDRTPETALAAAMASIDGNSKSFMCEMNDYAKFGLAASERDGYEGVFKSYVEKAIDVAMLLNEAGFKLVRA